MKKIFLMLVFMAFSFVSCGFYYNVQNKAAFPVEITKAKTISVSWLDVNPALWKDLGYKTEKDWLDLIKDVNENALQKEFMSDNNNRKTVTFRKQNEGPVNTVDINVQLKFVDFDSSKEYLTTEVKFLDKDGKELFSNTVVTSTKGSTGFASYSFDNRFWYTVYNLEQYLVTELYK